MQMAILNTQVEQNATLKVLLTPGQICLYKLKSHDKAAFKLLYRMYAPAIYGSISQKLNDTKVADQILEQTFLKAWENISSYDESKSKLFTWLLRISSVLCVERT